MMLKQHERFTLQNFLADIRTSWFLAWRAIVRGNRAILILTPIIIGFSIANLVFSSALFAGMIRSLNDQLIDNLFGHVLIEPPLDKTYLASAPNLVRAIGALPNVEGVTAHLKAGGRFSFDPDNDNLEVRTGSYQIIGIDPEGEVKVTKISRFMIAGRYLEPSDRDNIVIGAEVAGGGLGSFEKISLGGVRVGDKVRIIFPNGNAKKYTVVGIYKSGIDGIDMMTFLNRKEVEAVMNAADNTNEILVRVSNPNNLSVVIDGVGSLTPADTRISPWNILSNFTASMSSSFQILDIINGSVSLIIACTTIFIVTFINVINRRRQLGILKAIGVRENIIIRSYVLQTLFYGLLGSTVGAFIIFGIADSYFRRYPLDMGFAHVKLLIEIAPALRNVAIIIIAGLIAGFLPAWFTVRQSIIKAIWG